PPMRARPAPRRPTPASRSGPTAPSRPSPPTNPRRRPRTGSPRPPPPPRPSRPTPPAQTPGRRAPRRPPPPRPTPRPAAAQPPGPPAVEPVEAAWHGTWEAEDAQITAGVVYDEGGVEDANGFPASGGQSVGSLHQTDSRVEYHVEVPETAVYDLTITYGNAYGRDLPEGGSPTEQFLTVNGGAATTVTYPS